MRRTLLAPCLVASLLSGCYFVPTNKAPTSNTAGIGLLKVVVPQPEEVTTAADLNSLPWNRAKLIITPAGGGAAATYYMSPHDGLLSLDSSVAPLKPGNYTVRVDLLTTLASGGDLVVASGMQDGDAVTFQSGKNNVEVLVHPQQAGVHIATVPTELEPPEDDLTDTSTTTVITSSTSTDWETELAGALIGGLVSGAAAAFTDHPATAPVATNGLVQGTTPSGLRGPQVELGVRRLKGS